MGTVLMIIGCAMVLFTLLSVVPRDAWIFRIWDFPRVQVLLIGTAVFAAFLAINPPFTVANVVFSTALAGSLIYQGYMMFPYTFLAQKQVQKARSPQPGATFRVLFANVLMTNHRSADLLEIIRENDPDIILTVETDKWWADELAGLERSHPYTVLCPLENTYGMTLYSRLELIEPEVKFLIEDDIPSIHTSVRLRSGVVVELRCLHPRPPFPTEDESATARDGELMLVGRETKVRDRPCVVMGDLNDVAWSRTNYLFQDISGLLDPRVGRGFYNTFHAYYPFIRFPLDHFFISNHFRLIAFRRLRYFGSDHFPVFIELSFEKDAELVQEKLTAEPVEVDEAIEKITRALNA